MLIEIGYGVPLGCRGVSALAPRDVCLHRYPEKAKEATWSGQETERTV